MLSSLTVNMGVLESDVPDLFNDVYTAWTTWDTAYYTVDGSDILTKLENTNGADFSSMAGFYVGGLQEMQVTADLDGTHWMDATAAWANFHAIQLDAGIMAALDADPDGLIYTTSMRASADQVAGKGFSMEGWGPSGFASGDVMFGASSSKATGTNHPIYDTEFVFQWTGNILVGANGDTTSSFGPYKGAMGNGGDMREGGYDPLGNAFTTAAYLDGEDIVVSLFLTTAGIRMMINGQFVSMVNTACRNSSGVLLAAPYDGAAETAFFAQDASVPQMLINTGQASSQLGLQAMLSTFKGDYCAIHSGNKTDGYMKQVHSLLLNTKPV